MSTTAIKLTALVLMTIDHIGRYIPGMPLITRILGRASRPLFAFCAVQGLKHTSDSDRYLKRLYIFSIITGVMNYSLNSLFPQAWHPLNGNIFSSLFIALFIINCGLYGKKIVYLAAMLGFNTAVHYFVRNHFHGNMLNITDALFPEIFHCEGSIIFFVMVVLLYAGADSKENTARAFGGYCGMYLALILLSNTTFFTAAPMSTLQLLFRHSIQWLQILALPVMLMYNGRKGMGLKYLFYIYYPLHIAVLFMMGNIMY